jgi:hypothetical protein
MMIIIMSMGRDYVSEMRATNGPIVHPPVHIWAWRTMVEWCQQRKTVDSSTRVLWQSSQQSSASKQEEWVKRMRIWLCEVFLNILARDYFTRRKILRHGTSRFTSHSKEGVLRIFIALKNLSTWRGLNPWNLGPMASTLTTTPPRWLRLFCVDSIALW